MYTTVAILRMNEIPVVCDLVYRPHSGSRYYNVRCVACCPCMLKLVTWNMCQNFGMAQLNTEDRSCRSSQCVCFHSKYEALTCAVLGKNMDFCSRTGC